MLCSQQMKNNISIDALKAHIMAAAWNSDITMSNHHLHLLAAVFSERQAYQR